MLCDISRNDKGIQIDKIYDVEIDSDKIEEVSCVVEKLYSDRNYGFAKLVDSSADVYFHLYLFPEEDRKSISVGNTFEAEIIHDPNLNNHQIRRVINY